MVDGCTFCQIVRGLRPDVIVLRTANFFVFEPATRAPGKLLIAPVQHYQKLSDMGIAELGEWMTLAHQLQVKLRATSCKMQINVGAQHQNVRHLYMQFSYTER